MDLFNEFFHLKKDFKKSQKKLFRAASPRIFGEWYNSKKKRYGMKGVK